MIRLSATTLIAFTLPAIAAGLNGRDLRLIEAMIRTSYAGRPSIAEVIEVSLTKTEADSATGYVKIRFKDGESAVHTCFVEPKAAARFAWKCVP